MSVRSRGRVGTRPGAHDLRVIGATAVDGFVEKLKIVEDPNHPWTLCLEATADEIKAAADVLQAAVGSIFPAGQNKVDSNW